MGFPSLGKALDSYTATCVILIILVKIDIIYTLYFLGIKLLFSGFKSHWCCGYKHKLSNSIFEMSSIE